jgi:uncharacterized protein RhaS with RHS repeats
LKLPAASYGECARYCGSNAQFITTDYNTDNLPVKITDQEGKENFSEYDNEGRITRSTDGAGNEII